MSTMTTLPPGLREKLSALARRIRLLRALRGASFLIMVLGLMGGAALLADSWLGLPAPIRGLLLAAWVVVGALIALFDLVLPLCRPLQPEALAALIEEKYPELGERLTSAVELAGDTETFHGSPTLIALLLRETEVRTHPLDFLQTFPTRATGWLGGAAALVLVLTLTPGVLWPNRYAELTQRFLLPWRTSPVVIPYVLEVSPGNTVTAKGRPLTFAVQVRPTSGTATLPRSSTLIQMDAAGQTSRLPMLADRPEAFSLRLDRVPGDFRYCIETGDAVSETYEVTAIDPVDLVADSPTITVTPPAYAQKILELETQNGLVDLSALQYSQIRFDFHFSRPAVAARLEWLTPATRKGETEHKQVQALDLSADRLAARLDCPAVSNGTYQLVLEGEQGIRTEFEPRSLTVKIDQPPAFLNIPRNDKDKAEKKAEWKLQADATGSQFRPVKDPYPGDLKVVLPYDSVPVEVTLEDDVAVDRAEVEYRVNDGKAQLETIPLQGAATRQAAARYLFKLADKALKEGDVVRYRLKAADNRLVPEAKLEPNVVYHPSESRWFTLKIARQAEPLQQQEIIAKRDEINRRLEAIKQDLAKEQRELSELRPEARREPLLKPEQAQELKEVRDENRATESALRELARDLAETSALQPLGEKAQAVADQEMHRSDAELRGAEKETEAEPRERRLGNAEKEVASALKRLEEMRRANEQVAQARLDQMKLEMMAERQQALAERTAEQAAADPVKQPETQQQTEQLKREQGELANDVARLAEQSDPLRNALDSTRVEQAKQLADKARELAQAERDLAQAARERQQQQTGGRMDDLARKQRELADQAARLAQETRPATQAASTSPLKPEEARKAAESLQQGDAGEALKHQDQNTRELERVAAELQRATELARDPREAARQLARLQESLRQRLKEQVKTQDKNVPLAKQLQEIGQEQEAIRQAAKALALPEQNAAAQKDRQQADEHTHRAEVALFKPEPTEADARMKEAVQDLNRLADRLPSLEQRQRQARDEVARLRRQQDDIARQAERAVKDAAKQDPEAAQTHEHLAQQLADAARREADAAERLRQVDAPNQEPQRQRTQEALNRALSKLMDARPQDIGTTQEEARKELEHLEQALTGNKPAEQPMANRPDDKPNDEQRTPMKAQEARQLTRELANQQRQAAQATQQARNQSGDEAKQAQERLQKQQRALNEKAAQLPAEQSPRAVAEARATMNEAQEALNQKDLRQAQQKQNDAARALERLADKVPEKTPSAQQAKPQEPAAPPKGLPQPQQAEQARQLAKQQRDLREAVDRLAKEQAPTPTSQENAVAKLAKEQQQLAREAGEMARHVAQDQGQKAAPTQQAEQAAQSAQQTSKRLDAGSVQPAQQAGQQTAQQLRQLAQQLSQLPRGQAADPKAPDPVQQARQLAQRQEELNRQMEPLAANAEAQRGQQQARQQELQNQSQALAQELGQMAQQMKRPPQARQSTQQAAACCTQAAGAMQLAQRQADQNDQGQAQRSQEQAGQALDQAARHLDQAAQQAMSARDQAAQGQPANAQAEQQAGRALEQAKGEMTQAQAKLNQSQPQGAQTAMERAAQALQQAAQQIAQAATQPSKPSENSQPSEVGAAGGGRPDPRLLGDDMKKYAGKRWGELPGELRTKIIQDVKARYGDDYARIIKLYFEQLADSKK